MRNSHEMLATSAFQERLGERVRLHADDEAHTISDLLNAGNAHALGCWIVRTNFIAPTKESWCSGVQPSRSHSAMLGSAVVSYLVDGLDVGLQSHAPVRGDIEERPTHQLVLCGSGGVLTPCRACVDRLRAFRKQLP